VRVPGRNLVPGSAVTSGSAPPSRAPLTAVPEPDARQSRGLSSYQKGIHRARAASHAAGAEHDPEVGAGLDEQEGRS
jgi:hypothetical protein